MKSLYAFLRVIYLYRYTIWIMALQEIRSKYAGSVLGGVWNIIHPLVMVSIYWLVFSVGFKVAPAKNIPFLSWFFCAFAAWQTFSESLVSSSNSLNRHRTLIKKTVFPFQILPLVSIVASLINSVFVIVIMIIVLLIQGIEITTYAFQAVYFLIATSFISIGLGWFFSAASILLRDMGQILSVIIQVLFWATPIFYTIDMFPERFHIIWKLNPVYYLTEGFRYSFLYNQPFWVHPKLTLYFWMVAITFFVGGGWFFKKVKSDLVDTI